MYSGEKLSIRTLGNAAFETQEPEAIAIAQLLIESTQNNDTAATEKQLNNYAQYLTPETTHYVLIRERDNMVGAASVEHNVDDHVTYVHTIGVRSSERHNDYGSTLMREIARQAIARSDATIKLYALTMSTPFFASLGFTPARDPHEMYTTPESLLRCTPRLSM